MLVDARLRDAGRHRSQLPKASYADDAKVEQIAPREAAEVPVCVLLLCPLESHVGEGFSLQRFRVAADVEPVRDFVFQFAGRDRRFGTEAAAYPSERFARQR